MEEMGRRGQKRGWRGKGGDGTKGREEEGRRVRCEEGRKGRKEGGRGEETGGEGRLVREGWSNEGGQKRQG